MAADDRELRDRLETLQVRTKQLRAQLDDPHRLEKVHAEVADSLVRMQAAKLQAQARLVALRPLVEEARVESMRRKRERAEADALGDFVATGRVSFGIAALLGAAIGGLRLGELVALPVPGSIACALGAAGFVGLMWRVGAELRR